jgi:hypothetical protein
MGVQAVGNLPLNHFVTDLYQENRSPVSVLQENISRLEWKAFGLNALEKICYVALVAIMATILTISYSSVVLTGSLPLIIAGMAFSTPLIAWGLTKFALLSQQASKQIQLETGVLSELRQIENWTTPEISRFLAAQGILTERIPTEALKQLNAADPLRPLLPLIARFNYFRIKSNQIETRAKNALAELEESFRQKEAETHKPIAPEIKQKIRFECQDTAWRQHEQKGAILAINAMVISAILQNPTDQSLDIEPDSFNIPGVGHCVPNSFAERIFRRTQAPINDDYFFFRPELNKPPVSLKEIEENIDSPRNLQLLLLPNAIRA